MTSRTAIFIDPYKLSVAPITYMAAEAREFYDKMIHAQVGHEGVHEIPSRLEPVVLIVPERKLKEDNPPMWGTLISANSYFGCGLLVGKKLEDGTYDTLPPDVVERSLNNAKGNFAVFAPTPTKHVVLAVPNTAVDDLIFTLIQHVNNLTPYTGPTMWDDFPTRKDFMVFEAPKATEDYRAILAENAKAMN